MYGQDIQKKEAKAMKVFTDAGYQMHALADQIFNAAEDTRKEITKLEESLAYQKGRLEGLMMQGERIRGQARKIETLFDSAT